MVGMNARHNRHVGLEVRSHLERELFLTSFTALVTDTAACCVVAPCSIYRCSGAAEFVMEKDIRMWVNGPFSL